MDIKKGIKENLPAYQAKVNILRAIDEAVGSIKKTDEVSSVCSKKTRSLGNAKLTA